MTLLTVASVKTTESAHTKESMQDLAMHMDQARLALQNALFAKQTGCLVLAECFDALQKKNTELSEIINPKVGQDSIVQDDDFVQLSHKQITEQIDYYLQCCLTTDQDAHPDLVGLHFLPGFLLQVAEKARHYLADDPSYRKQIVKLQHQLHHARQTIVVQNTKLVTFIARKYNTSSINFSDVLQEGMVGLIKAVDRYDYERDICFSTYATYWIRQILARMKVRQEKIVRLPFGIAEKAPAIFEIMRSCYITKNRWPTLAEIKAQSDLSEDDIKTIISFYQSSFDVNEQENEDGETFDLLDQMEQTHFSQPIDDIAGRQLAQYLNEAVASLPEREANILMLRFGLKNHHEMTLQAIAEQLHVTRERVRQIQNSALKKLKQNCGLELQLYLHAE